MSIESPPRQRPTRAAVGYPKSKSTKPTIKPDGPPLTHEDTVQVTGTIIKNCEQANKRYELAGRDEEPRGERAAAPRLLRLLRRGGRQREPRRDLPPGHQLSIN